MIDHFTIYTYIETCCTPETITRLCVNYASVKLGRGSEILTTTAKPIPSLQEGYWRSQVKIRRSLGA